jgi:hypothetical protein
LIFALVLLAGIALVAVTRAAQSNAPQAPQVGAPSVVAYQGEVRVSDTPFDGAGYFKFAVVDALGTTTYWSNDGTSTGGVAPTAAVGLSVSDGLFSVLLGDTTLGGGMTQPLTADVFSQPDRYLRVWFSSDNVTFYPLTPDTRIAAVPYALQAQMAMEADTVDGLHASELETHYQNVVIVAQSGGDYTSVQAAIDSITDAAIDNPYLVWVAPGVYSETVAMQPHVHVQGAGQDATHITSLANSDVWPPDQATLLLASDTSLRDLTVSNEGAGDRNVALLATAGTTETLVADVTVRALGSGRVDIAIFLHGSGTDVTLQEVSAQAENAYGSNIGLLNFDHATVTLYGGTFTARTGMTTTFGIANILTTTLLARDVAAVAEFADSNNVGLYNHDGAVAIVRGGYFVGRGGADTGNWGIDSGDPGTILDATDVIARGETDGSIGYSCGLDIYNAATAVLYGGSFSAYGGEDAKGIHNDGSTMLDAEGVTGLAEEGSATNYGLDNYNDAFATLRGGAFTGRGGTDAYGIGNANGAVLEAESVTGLGENGSDFNYGLYSADGWEATLYGGSFIARGGNFAYGISTGGPDTLLKATGVTALGVDANIQNTGLRNYDDTAAAMLYGGSFSGYGGDVALGIFNYASTLEADSVTAAGGDGLESYGLSNEGGAMAMLHGGSFTARGGSNPSGIKNVNSGTMLEAEGVTALAEDGEFSFGLNNSEGAAATLHGGSFTARGVGIDSVDIFGIYNSDAGTMLDAEGVTALGENGSFSYGLANYDDAEATLRVGAFTARGAVTATHGIYNVGPLNAEGVTVLGEGANIVNIGLGNYISAMAMLRGGAFTGRGGIETWGIHNIDDDTALEAESVTALGEGGSIANVGLGNHYSATATLHGGSYTGRGGESGCGICNTGSGTWMEAENVSATASAETDCFGLANYEAAEAMLRGGAFTARGGGDIYGIYNSGAEARVFADNVTALGEDGAFNFGLANYDTGEVVLRGGAFTARGGGDSRGLYNDGTLDAEGVTARGEYGSVNYGLHNWSGTATADSSQFTGGSNGLYLDSGTVYLGVSQLDGNATRVSGTLVCYGVYDSGYLPYTCP